LTQDKLALAKHRLERANEQLKSAEILFESKMKRESSDYTDFYIVSRNEALEQISTAKNFVSSIEEYINQLISGNQNNQEN